jgi:sensor histidine kinase regulating citrate/malate metabolism
MDNNSDNDSFGSFLSKKEHTEIDVSGDQLNRWNELKEVLRVQTHAEVAKILLDR